MCGIAGYIGKNEATPVLLESLKRLEYRGYDSAGLAVIDKNNHVNSIKVNGKINFLEKELRKNDPLEGSIGIAHTRWATHGEPSKKNAHPHSDCSENIWVVHNGIIENYKILKKKLEKEGHQFKSDTDTEVISHLIEKYYKKNGQNLEKAVRQALKKIEGAYGLAIIAKDEPDKIIAVRKGSPLIIGLGQDEYFISSDPSAIIGYTKQVIYLDDEEMAIIQKDGFKVIGFDNVEKEKIPQETEWDIEQIKKNGFSHFMLKEIFEEPEAIRNSIRGRLIPEEGLAKLGGLESVTEKLREINRLIIVACGTARYAGLVGEYMIEEYAGIPVEVDMGSEFRYRKPIIDKKTAVLAISQSGETADTLAALREAKRKGALTLGITNVVGSTQTRETEAGVYNHVGPEIAVGSTKAFISQLTVLALLAIYLGRQREMSLITGRRIGQELQKLPDLAEKILKQDQQIKNLAKKYSKFKNFFFLGRKYNLPIAAEGALKLKEIAYYVHAESYPGGEMKHGPIALIDENLPSVFIVPSDSVYEKMINAIEETKARRGKIIAVATEGNEEIKNLADDVIYIPKTLEMLTPILSVIPLHLLSAYMGLELGCDIDKPRNLAKSVTVE
jgi:glucosamine--fructose-6-phosphate aminotransferase (isomerizing)